MSDKRVALITGGNSGIGAATAIEFAKEGYCVAITGRNQEKLNKVIDLMVENSPNKSKDNFLAIQADFEDQVQVESIVERTVTAFGSLKVVINNAGYAGKSIPFEHPEFYKDYQNVIQVNLMAPTKIAHSALPHITKNNGIIINVSSIADRCALLPIYSYCVSKAGLSMLTKCLAVSLSGTGARVITLAPGPIKTSFNVPDAKRSDLDAKRSDLDAKMPDIDCSKQGKFSFLKDIGESIDVANVIVFLCSEKARFINGSTVDVDGGAYNRMAASAVAETMKKMD